MGQRSLRKYLYDIPKEYAQFIDDFVGEHKAIKRITESFKN